MSNLINTNSELKKFSELLSGSKYITVDTEFIRDKTYFPKLCLLQMAGDIDGNAALIDPLAEGIDLGPVFSLMKNSAITKVFHACRQDIEIFYLMNGEIPTNIFDTQIAASVLGYGESVSYETLVNKIVGAELDKSSRYTDWAARPLSEKQMSYALSDVTHLRVIYAKLRSQLEEAGRLTWIEEEHKELYNTGLYQIDPQDAWRRLRYGTMRPKNLAVLRELARWREIEARTVNLPRGRIAKDETLLEIAAIMPKKIDDLSRLRSFDKSMGKKRMSEIFSCVERGLSLPANEYPEIKKSKKPPENFASLLAMLQLLLKVKSDVHGVAAPVIASKDDLEELALAFISASADNEGSRLMHGWRYDVFGREAKMLMEGKLKLSVNPMDKSIVFEEI